jgi:hypothetical protein
MDWQNLRRVSIWKVWFGIFEGASNGPHQSFKNLSKANKIGAERTSLDFKKAPNFERSAQ